MSTRDRLLPPTKVWVEQIMGLPISIHVRCDDPMAADLDACVQGVFAHLRQVDTLFSTYREDSQIRQLQRGELTLADAHPDLRLVHRYCEQLREDTNGLFNAWVTRDGAEVFDPTGWVKGWGVQQASRKLLERPDQDAYVNAGGDIQASRNRTDTPLWRIGIENPFNPQTLADVAELASGAIATSGNYARGEHLRDASGETAQVAQALASVTVTGQELQWVDAYATTAFAAGQSAVTWLEKLDGYSALVIDAGGDVHPVRWMSAAHTSSGQRVLSTDPTFTQDTVNLQ